MASHWPSGLARSESPSKVGAPSCPSASAARVTSCLTAPGCFGGDAWTSLSTSRSSRLRLVDKRLSGFAIAHGGRFFATREPHIAFTMGFGKKLSAAGGLVRAEGLSGPDQAKLVRAGASGEPITDGGFPAAKEFLAGYWIVDVDTPERAHGSKPLNMPITPERNYLLLHAARLNESGAAASHADDSSRRLLSPSALNRV